MSDQADVITYIKHAGRALLGLLFFAVGFTLGNRSLEREQIRNEVLHLEVESLKKQLKLANSLAESRNDIIKEVVAQKNNERLRANVFIDSYKSCMKVRNGDNIEDSIHSIGCF